MTQVSDCNAFMWHCHHNQFKDVLLAKKILFSLEHAGLKVFTDFKTGRHFDDKVAQKYLLEAIINNDENPLIIEMNYGFGTQGIMAVPDIGPAI